MVGLPRVVNKSQSQSLPRAPRKSLGPWAFRFAAPPSPSLLSRLMPLALHSNFSRGQGMQELYVHRL